MLSIRASIRSSIRASISGNGYVPPSLLLDFAGNVYAFASPGEMLTPVAYADLITFTRASGGGITNSLGQFEWVGVNVPRLTYDPATLQPLGLLVEEQRTNLLLRSTLEGGTAGTVGSGAVAPTGWVFISAGGTISFPTSKWGTPAIRTANTVGTDRPSIGQTVSVLAGTTYVMSATVESIAVAGLQIQAVIAVASMPVGATVSYLKNGIAAAASALFDVNDVIACVLTVSATAGAVQVRIGAGAVNISVGDVTLTMPQLEVGSSPSSYIPTTTAQVTRAADIASVNVLSPWYNATEGTLVVKAISNTATPTPNTPLALFDGAGTNILRLRFEPSFIYFESVKNGAGVVGLSANRTIVAGAPFKTAASFKDSSYAISYNGSAPVSGSGVAGSLPVVSSLLIGHHPYNSNRFNGIIQSITYYPRVIDVQQASA